MLIKTLGNKTLFLSNTNLNKIIDIKQKIFDIAGFPIINQKLFCETKLLEDHNDISIYKITNMSTIQMSLSLNGGGKGAVNNRGRHDVNVGKRELVLAKEGETVYAIVKTICGNKRVIVIRIDNGATVIGRISGSIHAWVKKDDVVLVGLRDFQEDKVDVIWRYTQEEARKLSRAGYIPQNSVINKNTENDLGGNIEFCDKNTINKMDDDADDEHEHINNGQYSRRYDMPESDDTSEDEEPEESEQSKFSDNLSKNVNDYSNTKKHNDNIDIDSI
jgi:translation initiation factor 1A